MILRNKQHSGFTLIELLVAAAVALAMLGIFLKVTNNVLDAWSSSADSLHSNSTARQVLDIVCGDLESLLIKNDNGIWLAAEILETTSNSGVWETAPHEKPAGATSIETDLGKHNSSHYRFGQAGMWVRFFASPVDSSASSSGGDINAIAYQLIRRNVSSKSSSRDASYNLYRSVVRGDYTMDEVVRIGEYNITKFASESTLEGSPGEIKTPDERHSLIARNIVDFGIAFYAQNSTGQFTPFFPDKITSSKSFFVPEDSVPIAADVFIRVLNKEGAGIISSYEQGLIPTDDEDYWWKIVNAHSTVFSKRVYFRTSGGSGS